jgi:methionyl-tRNA formyltransferase
MKNISKTIVFFGNERLATGVTTSTPTVRGLIAAGYTIAAIVINDNQPGTSRKQRELEIAQFAHEHNIPLLAPDKPVDVIRQLRSYDAVIGVLVAYGKLIPQAVLDLFPRGIINIHPSLLPLSRGPTPIETAMLEGSPITGVSIMGLVKEMDAGPVYVQKQQRIVPGALSKQLLADALLRSGADLLIEHLPAIIDGSLTAISQDHSKATYTRLITKDQGLIDWHKSAQDIQREVLAFAGWPRSRTTIAGKEVILTEVAVLGTSIAPGKIVVEDKTLTIGCQDDAIRIERLIPAGKKEMPVAAFLAGYKLQ